MVKLAVIADDLTGANDTAVQFAKKNIGSTVSLGFNQESTLDIGADVLVIDSDSRDIPKQEAYEKVKNICEILKRGGVNRIYKKVDSTLRGNLGTEIEAAASVMEPDIIVIMPAFPENRRITVGGCHFLDGIPIEFTELARAPKSPVDESRIVDLLKRQTAERIGLIPFEDIEKGVEKIKAAMADCLRRGEKWMVFDAARNEHLKDVVTAAKGFDKVLWVGSAGLAEYLPDIYDWSPYQRPRMTVNGGDPVLIIAGSVSEVTQAQIAKALLDVEIALVKVNVTALLSEPDREAERCAQSVKERLDAGQDVMLVSAENREDVRVSLAAGAACGMKGVDVSEFVAVTMGNIIKKLNQMKLSGLILTGGDTAIHVCRSLSARAIEILDEVSLGIPLGRLLGGNNAGLCVITKAGAFGEADCFIKSIRALRYAGEKKGDEH